MQCSFTCSLDNTTIFQADHPVGKIQKPQVMCCDNDTLFPRFCVLVENSNNFETLRGLKGCGRFIGKNQVRAVRDRAGNCNALFLPSVLGLEERSLKNLVMPILLIKNTRMYAFSNTRRPLGKMKT